MSRDSLPWTSYHRKKPKEILCIQLKAAKLIFSVPSKWQDFPRTSDMENERFKSGFLEGLWLVLFCPKERQSCRLPFYPTEWTERVP